MLNISLSFLTLARVFSISPLLSISKIQSMQSTNLNRIQFHRFVSPIFYSNANRFTFKLQNSIFMEGTSNAIRADDAIKYQTFSTRQEYKDTFRLIIDSCTFQNIKSAEQGGAFCVISDTHVLQLLKTQFINCSSYGADYVLESPFKISSGALLFTGSKATVQYCCFSKCYSSGNTKTFHIIVGDEGQVSVKLCYLNQNGQKETKDGHSLFSINTGSCQLYSINSTENSVPKGYAGGFIGGYARIAKILYSTIANNTGDSIFGMVKRDPQVNALVRSTAFIYNNATKYGVYMRLTSPSRLDSSSFFGNAGYTFYGNAPITFYHCTADCDKPGGLTDDQACQWNIPVLKHRHFFRVPCDCNVSDYQNMNKRRPPQFSASRRVFQLRRSRYHQVNPVTQPEESTSQSNTTTPIDQNDQTPNKVVNQATNQTVSTQES